MNKIMSLFLLLFTIQSQAADFTIQLSTQKNSVLSGSSGNWYIVNTPASPLNTQSVYPISPLDFSITTTGGKVKIQAVTALTGSIFSNSELYIYLSSVSSQTHAKIIILRNGTQVGITSINSSAGKTTPSLISFVDDPPAGTHNYSFVVSIGDWTPITNNNTIALYITNVRVLAEEI